jgi:hypothetical protein
MSDCKISAGAKITITLLVLLIVGCAPATVRPGPAGWPDDISSRRLYNTPRAYIYASNDAVAGEVDRLVASVAAAIAAQGGIASKGVVIVTDSKDGPLGTDAQRFYRAVRGEHSVCSYPADEDGTFMGMSKETKLLCWPMVIPAEVARAELKLPDDAAANWIVALPTRAMIDRQLVRSYAKSVRDQHEVKWKAITVAALPLEVALLGPLHHETKSLERDVVLFAQMAERQPKWQETERQARVYEYRNRICVERTWFMPVTWFPPL